MITTYPTFSSEAWECPNLFLIPHSHIRWICPIHISQVDSFFSTHITTTLISPLPFLIWITETMSNKSPNHHYFPFQSGGFFKRSVKAVEPFFQFKSYMKLQCIKHTKSKLLWLKRGELKSGGYLRPFHPTWPHTWPLSILQDVMSNEVKEEEHSVPMTSGRRAFHPVHRP